MALVNLSDRPAETLTDWEDGLEITAQSLVLVPISAIDDARDTVISAGARLGLLVDTSVPFDELEKSLDAVSFVQIDFPAFGDGRGFSLAVRLRKDKGFTGEIRAGGHLIPDPICSARLSMIPIGINSNKSMVKVTRYLFRIYLSRIPITIT